jgi:hypothetical protein
MYPKKFLKQIYSVEILLLTLTKFLMQIKIFFYRWRSDDLHLKGSRTYLYLFSALITPFVYRAAAFEKIKFFLCGLSTQARGESGKNWLVISFSPPSGGGGKEKFPIILGHNLIFTVIALLNSISLR